MPLNFTETAWCIRWIDRKNTHQLVQSWNSVLKVKKFVTSYKSIHKQQGFNCTHYSFHIVFNNQPIVIIWDFEQALAIIYCIVFTCNYTGFWASRRFQYPRSNALTNFSHVITQDFEQMNGLIDQPDIKRQLCCKVLIVCV